MPFVHRAIQCRVAVARSPGPVGGRVYVEDMSGTSRIDATSTIDARRMGVTAATSLLTRLGEVVVRVAAVSRGVVAGGRGGARARSAARRRVELPGEVVHLTQERTQLVVA